MDNTLVYSLSAAAFLSLLWRLTRKNALADVPGPPNGSWLTGNLFQLYHPNAESYIRYLQETFGNAVKTRGMFSRNVLFLSDPLALHHVLVKGSQSQTFRKTNAATEMVKWAFGDSLLSAAGEQHRRQRKMLNPLFSTKHMRNIMPILLPVASEMTAALKKRVSSGEQEVEVLSMMSRAALEYLGRGALGQSFGRYEDDQPTAHSHAIQELSSHIMSLFFLALATPRLVLTVVPAWARQKILELLPFRPVQEPLHLIKTLDIEARRIIDDRRVALSNESEEEHDVRKDVLSVLLKANSTASAGDRLSDSETYGQINMLLFAGQDTTSHALARILDQLAHFPEVQSKLRTELREAKTASNNEDLDYDTLTSLPHLDAICRETLRLFPPVLFNEQEAQKDTVLPLAWPIKSTDGKKVIKEILIPKGTLVMISMLSANRCKKIWGDDAEIWKPERWLAGLPKSVEEARMPGVYSSMMTFLGGPRACIGFKYSEMEMKLVLASLIDHFVFSPGPSIQWDISGVAKPDVEGQPSSTGRLPLKVAMAS